MAGPQDLVGVEAPVSMDRERREPVLLRLPEVLLARGPVGIGPYVCDPLLATAGQRSIHQEAQGVPEPAEPVARVAEQRAEPDSVRPLVVCVEGYVFYRFLGLVLILQTSRGDEACQGVPRRGQRPEACLPRLEVPAVPRPEPFPLLPSGFYATSQEFHCFPPLFQGFRA